MNYKNMFEITDYCENNGIELDKELVDILVKIKSINKKLFPLLKLESGLAKKLLKCYASFEKELSPLFEKEDVDFEEIIYCLNLIASQDNRNKMYQMRLACKIDAIREDKEALKLIASQDTSEKMREMRKACENDAIREDKVALELIASQDRWQKMNELRLACENDEIREDKIALNLIASQDTWQKMNELRYACENDAIRQDKELLELIAKLNTWEKMYELRLACEYDVIRKNRELLHLIASKETGEEMRQIWQSYVDKVYMIEQNKIDIDSQDKVIAEERARLEQEQQFLNLLRAGDYKGFKSLFQENPDLNAETTIKR